jgi:hypothetical protein
MKNFLCHAAGKTKPRLSFSSDEESLHIFRKLFDTISIESKTSFSVGYHTHSFGPTGPSDLTGWLNEFLTFFEYITEPTPEDIEAFMQSDTPIPPIRALLFNTYSESPFRDVGPSDSVLENTKLAFWTQLHEVTPEIKGPTTQHDPKCHAEFNDASSRFICKTEAGGLGGFQCGSEGRCNLHLRWRRLPLCTQTGRE